MVDPNKPKKIKKVASPVEPADHATLSRVLYIFCRKTNRLISLNEYVKVFNPEGDNLLGVGKFTWNKKNRQFYFSLNKGMTEFVGKSWSAVVLIDPFSANFEALTLDEVNEIVMPNL